MPEMLGWGIGVVGSTSFLTALYFVCKALGIKQIVLLWMEHVEMRAVARRMRGAGASPKRIRRFLAKHALARAGRSP